MLGSALWGWGVEQEEAWRMLDAFAEAGGGFVDAAVNYPINGRAEDFARSAMILSGWLKSRRPENVSVFYKIGSRNNLGGPETALSKTDLLLSAELARGRFAHWLGGLAIHWDDREDAEAIAESLEAMRDFFTDGLEIGFSGVRRPDLYRKAAPDLADIWWIQVKENAATCAARERYRSHFPQARYLAYGLNMGGVKGLSREADSSMVLRGLDLPEITGRLVRLIEAPPASLKPSPRTLNELALMLAFANPHLSGIVIGPRNLSQLRGTLDFWRSLALQGEASNIRRAFELLGAPA